MRSKPLLVGVVLLLATVCTTAPTPSPSPSPSPAASHVATIVLSPTPPRTCETTQMEAQAAVATATTVIATCLTCSGRFPPPSPGVAPITVKPNSRWSGRASSAARSSSPEVAPGVSILGISPYP